MKTLALPKSKLQPPPTKAEVIDALTRLRIEKLEKENKEGVALRKKLNDEAEAELIEFVNATHGSLAKEADTGDWYSGCSKIDGIKVIIRLEEKQLPVALKSKLREIHKLPERIRSYCYSDERKSVALAVSGMGTKDERVNALLKDEVSRDALGKMLEAIS